MVDRLRVAILHLACAIEQLELAHAPFLLERAELVEIKRTLNDEWHYAHNREENNSDDVRI